MTIINSRTKAIKTKNGVPCNPPFTIEELRKSQRELADAYLKRSWEEHMRWLNGEFK